MNPRPLVLGAAWLLTVAAAYLLGGGPDRAAGTSSPGAGPSSVPAPKTLRATGPGRGSGPEARRAGTGSRGVEIAATRPPRQAVAELANLGDPIARAAGFLELAESLTADEFRDVVHDFRSLGMTSERMSEYAILLHAWGQADPQGALDYALKNTGTNFARQTVLASWAGDDPDAALTWANNHAPEGKPNALLVGVIRGIAPHDLARATEILGTLPRSEERGDALRSMLPLILRDGIDAALAWSETIGESVLRQGAVTFIAQSISDEDPQQAADIVLALPDREFQERALYGIGASWADADLDGAIAWAESLDPERRDEAAAGIVADIASTDSPRAAEWMESLSSTTDIQPAIRSFVGAVARKDPALALAWTTELDNAQEAERSYHRVLGEWIRRDAPTARSWLEGHQDEVPESVRKRFAPDRRDQDLRPGR